MIQNNLENFNKSFKISLAMAKVNFTLRNEGSYLGIIWYLLNPLAMFLIIILIKKNALPSDSVKNYELYLLIGIIIFNFFKQSLSRSINTISSNINYLKSINNINPESLVMSGLIESVFSHFFDFILITGFMIFYKISLAGLLLYPFILFFFLIFLLGLSFMFATLGMYIKDFNNVWSIIAQLLFFLTPIFYAITNNNFLYHLNLFNPLFYFLLTIRSAVINFQIPPYWVLGVLIMFSSVSLVLGWLIFNKFKKRFSEL